MGGDGDLEPPPPIATARLRCAGCGADLPAGMLVEREGRWWCRGCLARTLPPAPLPPPPLRGWRAVVAGIGWRRLAVAIARSAAYVAAAGLCWLLRADPGSLLYACLTGLYSADNLTWLAFRLIELPTSVATFSLEALIAVAVGVTLIRWQGAVIVPQEPSAMAISFLVFLLVLTLKVVLRFARPEGDDA